MQVKTIIQAAWGITHSHRGLLWYGTIPAFFTTLGGVAYLTYQFFAFRASPFFGSTELPLAQIWHGVVALASAHDTTAMLVLSAVVVAALAYFLLPPFADGALIALSARLHGGGSVRGRDGVAAGFTNFLQLLELRLFLSVFSFFEFFTLWSLVVRHLGWGTGFALLFGVVFVLSLIAHLLFIYSEQCLVLSKTGLSDSLTGSARLAFTHLPETLSMAVIMLLIVVRTLLNVLLVFLIPLLISFVATFFAGKVALFIGLFLAVFVGLLALLLASYLIGMFHVFTTIAWTLTFLSLEDDSEESHDAN